MGSHLLHIAFLKDGKHKISKFILYWPKEQEQKMESVPCSSRSLVSVTDLVQERRCASFPFSSALSLSPPPSLLEKRQQSADVRGTV